MYLVVTKDQTVDSCCCGIGGNEIQEFKTVIHKAGKFDPNKLRDAWIKFRESDTIKEYLKKDPKNLTKKGTVRVAAFDRERNKRYIPLEEYLVQYAGFKKVNFTVMTDFWCS